MLCFDQRGCPILLIPVAVEVQNCPDRPWSAEYLGIGNLKQRRRDSMTPQPGDWRELAEQVGKEMDPDRLEVLIDELNRTLDRDERRRRRDAA